MSAERDVLIHYRMARARETLAEADLMAQSGHWHGCVNRLYYACFYAVTALLLRHDLSAGKFEEQQVRPWLSEAQRFVARVEELLPPPS